MSGKTNRKASIINVDVAIIGAGSAGMAAYRAARMHTQSVVLIEAEKYGTICARVGCMPSKLLIAAAEAAHRATHADRFGIHCSAVRVDGRQVMERVRRERDRFVALVTETVEQWPSDMRLFGRARFVDPHTLAVGDQVVRADRIVIATGSSPAVPELWRTLGRRVIVNDDVFDWLDLPESVAVAGMGVIGLELAQALSRLGVRVRGFGRANSFGPLTDPELLAKTKQIIGPELNYDSEAAITAVEATREGVNVNYSDASGGHTEAFDYLLVTTGRRPNVHDLALENAGIQVDEAGVPIFDPTTGQVGASHIFIAGDATQQRPLLHEAADLGRIAGDNAGRFPDLIVRPRRVPLSIVFSDPQIMIVGASRAELERSSHDFVVGTASFEDQGRSRVMGINAGALHVYIDRRTTRLLGAEMVGPNAEHIGHLLAWAQQAERTLQQMLDSPFYHPVVEEGVRTALRAAKSQLGDLHITEPCIDCTPAI
ncbi:MAG: dihydrolipoyl dehydrogenase [Hyphomicrobium sp.]|nr:dihydrolipoyl dehydrogenase [Hyphomicrobium sp.]